MGLPAPVAQLTFGSPVLQCSDAVPDPPLSFRQPCLRGLPRRRLLPSAGGGSVARALAGQIPHLANSNLAAGGDLVSPGATKPHSVDTRLCDFSEGGAYKSSGGVPQVNSCNR